MKIALLADIHGNALALEAVLKTAKKKKVEKLFCCGDYVGYYYEPEKVISLLDCWDWNGVSGNHEALLNDWIMNKDRDKIKLKHGLGTSVAATKLSKESLSRIINMPKIQKLKIEEYNIILCHGSPWNRDEYIYPDSNPKLIERMFSYDPDFDILVYGHTHYPVIWEKENKKIINPGSIGQPRDRIPGASWALWDTQTNNVEFFREKYDVNLVIEMCKKFNPEISYLREVLLRK